MSGVDLSGADLSGADLAGADLKDAILVGAKTWSWNVQNANMEGVLTDAPAGADIAEIPVDEMLRAHALWCESGGRSGKPSSFDATDLRSLKSIRGLNLTALSAKGAVFYGLGHVLASSCRAPTSRARICAPAIFAAPTCAAPA